MRKWFYAGAVVGGFLLLGAAPAHADVIPAPAGGLLSSVAGGGLDPAGGLNLESPLGGTSQLMNVKPGQNSADFQGSAPAVSNVLPQGSPLSQESDEPAGRRPGAGAAPADLPIVGGLTGGGSGSSGGLGGLTGGGSSGGLGGVSGGGSGGGTGGLSGGGSGSGLGGLTGGGAGGGAGGGLTGLVPANLLGGGLLGGGLTPDGRSAANTAPRESALFDGGLPLLGGLGGLTPANETPTTLPADGDDPVTGMPAGGTAVDPALVDPPKDDTSTADEPVDDPRLHEEPTDGEAGGDERSFSSGGRPIAGEDKDFK
ncbi:hypothetical protein [Actinoplanes friuliensis]|uniref:Uncharacterized protein n=1 Tax=Actinoplanes friuliensis DSM 7358 TaxID=1246995 RepID=U5WEU0_9ACTN|nr:hypothetical protein [Actinoplanes friuliensis]AGZ46466.1 hypothetical protein AFR_41060 [Actinoplanes friuliensis DSM 7358]